MTGGEPTDRPALPGIEVVRAGRVEAFLHARPALSSAGIQWGGLAVEDYHVPACVIAQHEHVHDFLHVVLRGNVRYEVLTAGKCLRYTAEPGTTFVLPRGTIDELRWLGPTHRIAVALHPSLLLSAIDETIGQRHIELTQHWNASDRHIMSVLLALTTDLDAGSPAGRLYGESLANALAVYLLSRYAVQRRVPMVPRGGLPGYRLKRVLDYIGDNLAEDVSLSDLAELAGMSAHHFAELFKRSMSCSPHRYVLRERIERAKIALRDPSAESWTRPLSRDFRIQATLPECFAGLSESVRRNFNRIKHRCSGSRSGVRLPDGAKVHGRCSARARLAARSRASSGLRSTSFAP